MSRVKWFSAPDSVARATNVLEQSSELDAGAEQFLRKLIAEKVTKLNIYQNTQLERLEKKSGW
jgi:hypothetical protein